MGGGQRQHTHRADPFAPENFAQLWETRFLLNIRHLQGFLRFEHAPRWAPFGGQFETGLNTHGSRTFQNVQSHDVARLVVQDQVQIVKLQDAVQPARQIVEELAEVAVPGDGLGDFQQDLVLAKRRARGQRFGRRNFHSARIAFGLRQANAQ